MTGNTRQRQVVRAVAVVVAAVLAAGPVVAAGRGEPGPLHRVHIATGADDTELLDLLRALDIDVDGAFDGYVRAYVIDEELDKLVGLGLDVRVVPEPPPGTGGGTGAGNDGKPLEYHTYETLTSDLQAIAALHPDIARLSSIGTSVQGRELWVMKLSRNPDVEEDEPEFLYVAAMHGDEVVGKELAFALIDHLADADGTDPRVTALLDTTEIWILPSLNPDGTALTRRYNANFVDLNRDFPDQFDDPVNTPEGREPETAAVMTWSAARSLSLTANFHGGAVVANYPFDSNASGTSVYSPSPDDDLFLSLARTYADNNPEMAVSNGHPSFNHGVCNGADWYAIRGGMQDWSYVWRGAADLTLEVSSIKWPAASTLDDYWNDNLESMLAYLERVHDGARGVVTDAGTGQPIAAEIRISGNPHASFSDPDVGDWHRVMLPGTYDLEISAVGYVTRLVPDVVVPFAGAVRVDTALAPLATDLQPIAGCVPQAGGGSDCAPWLPLGAPADLTVTLRNTGSSGTSITGRLEPIGWFAEVSRPEATYPDLVPGAAGDSTAPGHGVDVAADAPIGHKAGFVVRWEAAEGDGLSEPIFLPIGPETCSTAVAGDVPLAVLDRQTTESGVTVADELEITRVEVAVDVSHSYRSDLRIDLLSPAGTAVTLHDRSGGSADDVVGTYGVDLTPFEPFDRIAGEASAGAWTLRVDDGVPGNTGTLDAWSLTVCGRPFESSPPEVRLRDVRRDPAGVRAEWWPYPGVTEYRVYRSTDPSSAGDFVDVTAEDDDASDTTFLDTAVEPRLFWIVTGVGEAGEGPKGHFGE